MERKYDIVGCFVSRGTNLVKFADAPPQLKSAIHSASHSYVVVAHPHGMLAGYAMGSMPWAGNTLPMPPFDPASLRVLSFSFCIFHS